MSTSTFAWLSFLLLLLCLHSVCSETLQFLKIPQSREILAVGANLTINCTTNNPTAQTAVYYRRRISRTKWKKIKAIPGKVIHEGSVYTLLGITKNNKGQYQCRAWGNSNSTETRWPDGVGVILVRRELNKGRRKPDSKVPGNKKPGPKRPKSKKQRPKKPDKKKNNRQKPQPGSKKPGAKRPGRKRGGGKKPGRKPTGPKRPGKKGPGSKKPSIRRGPPLKVSNKTVIVNEGALAVMKCTAQVQGSEQPIISWFRAKRLIGCSDTKDMRCKRSKKAKKRYLITYMERTASGGNRKKLTSYLRVPKTRRARDQGVYVCMARNQQGSTRQSIRLRIVKKRSSS